MWCENWCKVDNLKKKLTKQKAQFVSCPLISESPVSIECRVKQIKKMGSHDMFLAEVLSIDAAKQYIDEKGYFSIEKCDLISYSNGNYYTMGKPIGKIWIFCTKEETKIQIKCPRIIDR